MPIVKRTRSAQYPLVAEFVFNYNDGMANLSSLTAASVESNLKANVTDFGSRAQPTGLLSGVTWTASGSGAHYFEAIALPYGAQIIGGEVQPEILYVGPSTVTLSLGDVNSGTIYASAVDLIGASANSTTVSSITNATVGNPTLMAITMSATTHQLTPGKVVNITGCTGASTPYNGSYVVTVGSSGSAVVNVVNNALTSSLTTAGSPVLTQVSRTALSIPCQKTDNGGYVAAASNAYDAAAGADIRATLTFGNATAATQGRVRVRVMYTIDGRGNEVITT